MTALDERHKRLLLITFRHLDKMLSEVYRRVEGKGSSSVLSDRYTELDPEKNKIIQRYTNQLRAMLCRIIDEKGISIDAPLVDIKWYIHNHLNFIDISAEEIRPKYMRGYGELTEEAAAELDAVAEEIQTLIRRMRDVLKQS